MTPRSCMTHPQDPAQPGPLRHLQGSARRMVQAVLVLSSSLGVGCAALRGIGVDALLPRVAGLLVLVEAEVRLAGGGEGVRLPIGVVQVAPEGQRLLVEIEAFSVALGVAGDRAEERSGAGASRGCASTRLSSNRSTSAGVTAAKAAAAKASKDGPGCRPSSLNIRCCAVSR